MIEVDGVTFTYEGQHTPSLHDVSLRIGEGECVLVTGPSGCGKSTLLRLVNGLIPHFFSGSLDGHVRVGDIAGQSAGRSVSDAAPDADAGNGSLRSGNASEQLTEAHANGRLAEPHANGRLTKDISGPFEPGAVPLYEQAGLTGSVFQNPRTQFYTTDTTSELAFALENRGVPESDIIGRVEQVANDMRLAPLMDRSLFALSGGEKQKIACACVQVADTDIVLLDEPTANLDYDASLMLADIIRSWKRQGKTILIAEHRIAWILNDITRLIVMKDGNIVREMACDELAEVDEEFCRSHALRSPLLVAPDEVALPAFDLVSAADGGGCTIENLHFGYTKDRSILDFDRIPLARGRITAVVGRNGRGKTTFLRCLTGLEKKDKSVLRFGAETWDRKARIKNVFLIAQDVNCQLFTQSVHEEVEISLPEGQGVEQIDEVLASLDLSDVADRDPFTLSGGQKQRVAIACAVASGRKIVAFDEPTSGLGYGHMLQFAALLRQLSEQGRTVIVVTHDTELIETAADYLLVL